MTTASTTSTPRCRCSAPVPAAARVTQSNSATNAPTAGNANATLQGVGQGRPAAARASGGPARGSTPRCSTAPASRRTPACTTSRPTSTPRCSCTARAPAAATSTQSNTASNDATAGNANATDQARPAGAGRLGLGRRPGPVGARRQRDAASRRTPPCTTASANIYAPVCGVQPRRRQRLGDPVELGRPTARRRPTPTTPIQGVDQGQAGQRRSGPASSQYGHAVQHDRASRRNGSVFNVQANIYAPVTVGGGCRQWCGAASRTRRATALSPRRRAHQASAQQAHIKYKSQL